MRQGHDDVAQALIDAGANLAGADGIFARAHAAKASPVNLAHLRWAQLLKDANP